MILRRIFIATSAVVAVAGIVTACSSVPDFTFDDDAGGTQPLPDGRVPDVATDGAKADGSGDATVDGPKDALTDVICTPSNGGVEDCDDGLDNDCNGKTDCADTACTPLYQCIPTPPVGWTLTAESDDTRPACPTDYATTRDIQVVTGTGSGTCSCTCALTNGTEACILQQSSVLIATTNACASAANGAQTPQIVSANATNCTALTTNIDLPNPNSFGQVTTPANPPSGCSPTVTKNGFPAITAGRTCTPPTPEPAGGGCGIGQVCARKTGVAGLALCVQKAGTNTCPSAAYPTRKTAGGETFADGGVVDGGATQDNRDCNTCSCSSPTCTNASVTLSDQADCTTGGSKNTSGPMTTACAATTNKNFTATHYKSTITAGGCTPTFNPASTNGIAFTDTTTICCP